MPDTDKSVSALATNGHVLDKSKTNPLEFFCGNRVCAHSIRLHLLVDEVYNESDRDSVVTHSVSTD